MNPRRALWPSLPILFLALLFASATVASASSKPPNPFGAITSKLNVGIKLPYSASYKVTSNSGSETIQYASKPPSSFSFRVTSASGLSEDFFDNGSKTYVCTESKGTSKWTCLALPKSEVGAYDLLAEIYQGTFWTKDFAVYAAAASKGITVASASMKVAGQQLSCVTYHGGSSGAGGEVCVTSKGLLGYVHVNSSKTTFELTSLSGSPAASDFSLPPGAKVTSIP